MDVFFKSSNKKLTNYLLQKKNTLIKSSIKINQIMKNNFLKATSLALFFGVTALAQQNQVAVPSTDKAVSKYNYHDTFGPNFYSKNGRSE